MEKCCDYASVPPITCGVSLNGALFLGTTTQLFRYSPGDKWLNKESLSLPQGLSEYSLAVYNNQLHLIGGRLNGHPTNKVFTCVFGSKYCIQRWYETPSLVKSRTLVSTASDDNVLLAAGGRGDNNTQLRSMEIYMKDCKSWNIMDLPALYKPGDLDLLIVNQNLYCSGLTNLLDFHTNKPARLFYSAPMNAVTDTKPQWKLIKTQAPFRIKKFCEQIVSVANQVVQVYLPCTESWETVFHYQIQEQINLIVSLSAKAMIVITEDAIYRMTSIGNSGLYGYLLLYYVGLYDANLLWSIQQLISECAMSAA